MDDPTPALAARLRLERDARGWSLAELAQRSGVSKAMISKVERGQASPTAALLGRLSGALGLTMSALLARAEGGPERVTRATDQPRWRDPKTGYIRRQLSPPASPIELVRVELPARRSVAFPASSYAFVRHLIWVLDGHLTFVEGDTIHELDPGDCLLLGPPSDCMFRNTDRRPCIYLVALVRQ
jgi:transcriptional regulator with XRE-family HTH domain